VKTVNEKDMKDEFSVVDIRSIPDDQLDDLFGGIGIATPLTKIGP
jgi:hypothetical protein